MDYNRARFDSFQGHGPDRVPHWEHWSDPDAATYISGINYYDSPQSCMKKLDEMYPFVGFNIPESDDPLPRIEDQEDQGHGRWGGSYRDHWQQDTASHRFESIDDMFNFSPLEQADFTGWKIVEDGDFSSEEVVYQRYRKEYPDSWGDTAPANNSDSVSFYNTTFMWPLLTFGYENFLNMCLDPRLERIMDEFAGINRRVFGAFARLPVNYVVCHDDIVLSSGPVCSPEWMHKYVFPRYEEYWSMLKASGKEVIFMVDGCVDAFADDVMACGACGIISEPFTDYRAIARRYDNPFIAGEGDVRVLMENDADQIRKMVEGMVETSKMSGGYMMCVGNHIPFNAPGEGVKLYLDISAEIGYRS